MLAQLLIHREVASSRICLRRRRYLSHRENHVATPLHSLAALAASLGVGALHVKDEGHRLGLGSFKALGGAYAVANLVLEEARGQLGRCGGLCRSAKRGGSARLLRR